MKTDPVKQIMQHPVWDAVIVGCGPASCAAANTLAQKGWKVLVIEQHEILKNRYGESLPPAAVALTQQLLSGIKPEDYAQYGIKATPGYQSSWIDEQLDTYDFMSQPGGHGLCVNRLIFDARLRETAIAQGAHVAFNCRFLRCHATDSQQKSRTTSTYQLAVLVQKEDTTAQEHTITTRILVDATGRSALVAKSLGIKPQRFDKLCAFIRQYRHQVMSTAPDFTLLEASKDGWWYSNLLPDGQTRVVVFHTDRDLPQAQLASTSKGFEQLLAATLHISNKLQSGKSTPTGEAKITAAGSQCLTETRTDNFVAIGDAAMAFDPLSSQGMLKALENGVKAGQLIAFTLEDFDVQEGATDSENSALSMPSQSQRYLQRYQASLQQHWRKYQQEYQYYYQAQPRWRDSEFWCRRRSAIHHPKQHERIAL